jgi:phage terminase Nu1 subunit (DNA packaging protein)
MDIENVTVIKDNLWTTKMVAKAFSVEPLTIYHWRRRKGLPYIEIRGDGKNAVRFDLDAVKEWAKKNGKQFRGTKRESLD